MKIERDIVDRAVEILSVKEHWTALAAARAADGRPVDVVNKDAVQFCALGALGRAYYEMTDWKGAAENTVIGYAYNRVVMGLAHFCRLRFDSTIAGVNDSMGYDKVVEAMKEYRQTIVE